jgi:hypothetical protein
VQTSLYGVILAMAQGSREHLALYFLYVEKFLDTMMPHPCDSHGLVLLREHNALDCWLFSQWMHFHHQMNNVTLSASFLKQIRRNHIGGKEILHDVDPHRFHAKAVIAFISTFLVCLGERLSRAEM